MRMYQDKRRLDFPLLGRKIKRKREAKGWTQEYLAQLVERIPHSIIEKRTGSNPSGTPSPFLSPVLFCKCNILNTAPLYSVNSFPIPLFLYHTTVL